MIATNHYLVGVAGAVVLRNPALVVPVSFMSHFALDALPHFGLKFSKDRGKILVRIAIIDTLLILLMVSLTVHNYPNWYVLAGLVAVSPDFAWIYRFTVREKFGKLPPSASSKFNSWHASIQKFESIWGGVVEVSGLVILSLVLFR